MNRQVSTMPDKVIRELARQITLGNTCYVERYNGRLIVIDNKTEDEKLLVAQEKSLAEIEKRAEKYVKVVKIGEKDQLLMMNDFLDTVTDKSVRKELLNSLRRKSPVRNFTNEVEGDMGLNQQWVNFYTRESERWVKNFLIDAYNY